MRTAGLRRRVVLAALGTVAVALGVVTAAFNLVLDARLSRDANQVVRSRAQAQLATLAVTDGRLRVQETPNDALLDERVWVLDAAGSVLERAPGPPGLQRAVARLAVGATERHLDLEDLRLLALPVRARGAVVGVVVAGVSLVPYDHTSELALVASLILDAILLVAVALLARRSATIALRPVSEMTRAAAAWSDHDLDRRFDLGPPRDELTALAATLDTLLGRLAAALRHEQRLTAELSHELRTPLAALRTEAELALRRERSSEELGTAVAAILDHAQRMQSVVDALMTAAEHEAGAQRESADALAAARLAAERARAEADERGVRVAVAAAAPAGGRALTVSADRELTVQILAPLLENAVRYGRSDVSVQVAREDGTVVVTVRDDGPGLALGESTRVFQPGVRGAAAEGRRGAGLGLPLARRLARAVGGDVAAADAPDGGCFVVRLPSA